uniref:NADH-ubiquinone oxidoreductase chain 6 n=1 Tax=Branchinella kugenumaensis TaxID=381660 RepID=A0A7U3P093_9CRUS|nr:NADH dehydrogenase subunit 6 [Branchinella kugenumaensis]QPD06978.1 NADH dehydrogenase subunit 6 [Branchinella kugenumaensis]
MYLMILMVTSLMLFLNHPLSFALSLFVQTLLICLIISQVSYWVPLILFLIFLGGILVMFMYVASLSSNEKFMFDISSFMIVMVSSSIFYLMMESNPTIINEENFVVQIESIINLSSSLMYIFMTIYLFLTLILIVEFLNMNKKPLRSSM